PNAAHLGWKSYQGRVLSLRVLARRLRLAGHSGSRLSISAAAGLQDCRRQSEMLQPIDSNHIAIPDSASFSSPPSRPYWTDLMTDCEALLVSCQPINVVRTHLYLEPPRCADKAPRITKRRSTAGRRTACFLRL